MAMEISALSLQAEVYVFSSRLSCRGGGKIPCHADTMPVMTTRNRGRPPHDDVLTPAEWRVLHGVQHGFTNRALAEGLGISIDAIKYHLRNICGKTGARNKRDLQRKFIRSTRPKAVSTLDSPGASLMNNAFGSLGQISRTVSNCEQSRNWFELVLELPHLYTFGTLSFFDCNGTRLMLSQKETAASEESILYFKVSDIASRYEQLKAKGVEFIAAPHKIHTHADGTEEWMAFFKDPDARPLALMSQLKA